MGVHRSFLAEVLWIARHSSDWWAEQSLQGLFRRTLAPNRFSTPWIIAPLLAKLLWFISCGILFVTSYILTIGRSRRKPLLVNLSLWLVTGMLICPRTWDHYFIWLLIPIVIVFWHAVNNKK